MTILFFKKFHQDTKILFNDKLKRFTPNQNLYPQEWKTTYFKVYDGATKIQLPKPLEVNISYSKVIESRVSHRSLDKNSTLNISEISTILHLSVRQLDETALDGRGRRPIASAGPLFPLETYIYVSNKLTDIDCGVYHYRPDIHSLELVQAPGSFAELDISKLFIDPIADTYPVAIFITSIFERSTIKYKDRAYRYILLEAGAVGQAIQNAATLLGQKSLIFGGTFDDSVEKILGVDGEKESLVNSILLK